MFSLISRFQEALAKYGVSKVDIFQTNDLFEKKDMANVTNTIFALGRAVNLILFVIIKKDKGPLNLVFHAYKLS